MFLKCAERQARLAAITLTRTRRQGSFESGAKAHQIALQLSMDTQFYELIPTRIDHDPCAHWRMPMDMMRISEVLDTHFAKSRTSVSLGSGLIVSARR
jgi:hypothetical protein